MQFLQFKLSKNYHASKNRTFVEAYLQPSKTTKVCIQFFKKKFFFTFQISKLINLYDLFFLMLLNG